MLKCAETICQVISTARRYKQRVTEVWDGSWGHTFGCQNVMLSFCPQPKVFHVALALFTWS